MTRLFTMGRRLNHLSLTQYHTGLLQRHAPLVQACKGFVEHCNHYRQNHAAGEVQFKHTVVLSDEVAAFDNCSEFWFDSIAAVVSAFNNDDYFRMLRPDEKKWSDPQARIAFLADEAVLWDGQSVEKDGMIKVLCLGGATMDGARNEPAFTISPHDTTLRDRYPAFFNACARYVRNTITGQMDFERARIADKNMLPYTYLWEFWFATREQADAAFNSADGRTFVAQNVFTDKNVAPPIAFWAIERVVL